ncbi:unnamed protein product [Ranitomeya imitator]|uniref:Somatoliberin n=1 Tax=Ranitomeya imitator TaxID=111125 RepID=A0ABN9LF64_9NEOB|nr:unnamed protein product [Ranitomeya imitator]
MKVDNLLLMTLLYTTITLLYSLCSYEQTSKSSRNVNLPVLKRSPMQDWSLNEAQGFVRGLSEKRMERHVDAIFTNTYRKFLGQISARRYLQNMMGKRLGPDDVGALYSTDSEIGQRTLRDTLASVLTSL